MDISTFTQRKKLRDHLVNLTKELVGFPSHLKEPLKTFELMEFIKSYFEMDHLNIQSFVHGGVPSMVVTFEETRHTRVLLSGHIDVVTSATKFTATEEDGKLFGTGTLDMKGGVACMMALMKYFVNRDAPPPSLALMITSDEEVGSRNGTEILLGKEGYRANFAIINEGRSRYELVTREKGILILKLVAMGEYIHSAYPWKAANPLELLMKTCLELKKLFPKAADRWAPTATVTIMHGGKETNTIPGTAEAYINVRLTDKKTHTREKILEKIRAQLPQGIELFEEMHGEVFIQDPKDIHVQLLRKTAESVVGKKLRYGENHGASDARLFMMNNIPAVALGPVGLNHHTPNEFVEIESLIQHFSVLKDFVEAEEKCSHSVVDGLTERP
ncbi:hypothetical protein CO046_01745 [Candidatus Peregrinibacteria bacterium CG_4_9_14_0_2_um_filter_53_11]|nr:MAG: hypothetical protein CO046_01745 [Candidatus Peregrinibacteria bacterium CG_4_9_14_0_2_um_filter_53_11]